MKVINIQDIDIPEDCATYDELAQFADKIAELALNYLEVDEPKRGRWLPHPTERAWDVCSACGIGCKRRKYGVENGKEWVIEYGYQYCPNCGSRMDKE